eukprot:3578445-Amphidinium_carterae.2
MSHKGAACVDKVCMYSDWCNRHGEGGQLLRFVPNPVDPKQSVCDMCWCLKSKQRLVKSCGNMHAAGMVTRRANAKNLKSGVMHKPSRIDRDAQPYFTKWSGNHGISWCVTLVGPITTMPSSESRCSVCGTIVEMLYPE